jgi:hypothetical protein
MLRLTGLTTTLPVLFTRIVAVGRTLYPCWCEPKAIVPDSTSIDIAGASGAFVNCHTANTVLSWSMFAMLLIVAGGVPLCAVGVLCCVKLQPMNVTGRLSIVQLFRVVVAKFAVRPWPAVTACGAVWVLPFTLKVTVRA